MCIAGTEAHLQTINNKGHAMIRSEEEMRHVMTFWAKHLKSAAPAQDREGSFVEVYPTSMPEGLQERVS